MLTAIHVHSETDGKQQESGQGVGGSMIFAFKAPVATTVRTARGGLEARKGQGLLLCSDTGQAGADAKV